MPPLTQNLNRLADQPRLRITRMDLKKLGHQAASLIRRLTLGRLIVAAAGGGVSSCPLPPAVTAESCWIISRRSAGALILNPGPPVHQLRRILHRFRRAVPGSHRPHENVYWPTAIRYSAVDGVPDSPCICQISMVGLLTRLGIGDLETLRGEYFGRLPARSLSL